MTATQEAPAPGPMVVTSCPDNETGEADVCPDLAEDDMEDHHQVQRLLSERWVVEDEQRWTIFEDLEDELRHHRKRSRALSCFVRAYSSLREEYDRLQEGGLSLQEAYEQLQDELREAVGDTAYWQELAEARREAATEAQMKSLEPCSEDVAAENIDSCHTDQQDDGAMHEKLRSEMLKDARSEVFRWRRVAEQRAEEIEKLNTLLKNQAKVNNPEEPPATKPANNWPRGAGSLTATRLSTSAAGKMTPARFGPPPRLSSSQPHSPAKSALAAPPASKTKPRTPEKDPASPGKSFYPRKPLSASPVANGVIASSSELKAKDNSFIPSDDAGAVAVENRPVPATVAALSATASSGTPSTKRRIHFENSAPPCVPEACSPARASWPACPSWQPGSTPKRCSALGTPTRRKEPPGTPPRDESQRSQDVPANRPRFISSPQTQKSGRRTPVNLGQPTRKIQSMEDSPYRGCQSPCSSLGTRTPPVTRPSQRISAQRLGQEFRPSASAM